MVGVIISKGKAMKMFLILSSLVFGFGLVTPGLSQESPAGSHNQSSGELSEVSSEPSKFCPNFQVGVFKTLNTNIEGSGKTNYLVTLDFFGLKCDRTKPSFGGGLHFAFDENVPRLGLKGLWRTPLEPGSEAYFQLSPGVYVFADGPYEVPSVPGYFLEAELGFSRYFALALEFEMLRYENRYVGYDMNSSF